MRTRYSQRISRSTVRRRGPVWHVLAWSIAVGLMHIAAPSVRAESPSDVQPGAGAAPAEVLARIEVVGSRIRRVDVETGQPILVIERPEIERSGQMSLGEFLQDLTIHGGALNTTVNNGGDGSTRIDLRNLGEQRTLVLVDGRRWIAGIDGAVDLNSIPLAIVERIEVLKDGASAVYGSDAIGGVVSITTRREFNGGHLEIPRLPNAPPSPGGSADAAIPFVR